MLSNPGFELPSGGKKSRLLEVIGMGCCWAGTAEETETGGGGGGTCPPVLFLLFAALLPLGDPLSKPIVVNREERRLSLEKRAVLKPRSPPNVEVDEKEE